MPADLTTGSDRLLRLEPSAWWEWSEQPCRVPGWGAAPVFLCDLSPCGTGRREIRLRFVEVTRQRGPGMRVVVLRIQLHRPELIVGTCRDDDGTVSVATIARCTSDWLRSACPQLLLFRPPRWEQLSRDGSWLARDYLRGLFGRNEAQITGADHRVWPGRSLPRLPRAHLIVSTDRSLPAWESWLLALGYVPLSQDDRWCVDLAEDGLCLRRSWTGFLIYLVETSWVDDRLHLHRVGINRDPSQYRIPTTGTTSRRCAG